MFIQVLSPLSWDCQQAQFINWHLQNTPLFTRTDPISSQWLHLSDTNTKWAVATKGKFTCNKLNKRVQRQKSLQNVEASCRMFWKACLKCFKTHCDYQGITHCGNLSGYGCGIKHLDPLCIWVFKRHLLALQVPAFQLGKSNTYLIPYCCTWTLT